MKKRSLQNYFVRSANIQTNENTGKKIITGIIPYNSRSENLRGEYGCDYYESIAPTAFNKTLTDRAKVLALYSHDTNRILGNTENETLKLESREDGLYATCTLPETSYANDAWELIRSGTAPNLSFGFIPIQTEEVKGVNVIREAKLVEVSFCVGMPAYPETDSVAEKRNLKIGDFEMDINEIQALLDKTEPLSDDEKAKINELMQALSKKVAPVEDKSNPVQTASNTTEQKQPETKQPSNDTVKTDSTVATDDEKKKAEQEANCQRMFDFEYQIAESL